MTIADTDFLGAYESSKNKLDDIICHRPLLFPSITIYFLWATGIPFLTYWAFYYCTTSGDHATLEGSKGLRHDFSLKTKDSYIR
jgi:hypothetical protein